MSKDIKSLVFNGMMTNFEMVNPEFAKVKVYVCYAGKNRNRSEIPRDVLDEMAKSIYGIPVVAEYDEDNNCFKGHGGKLEITDEGMDFIQTTIPYGFVDPTTPVFYEKVKELDGITENEYLCCYAYLWYKRYPEVEAVLRNQDNKTIGQSMEISLDDYEWSDEDYCVVKKGHFSALAMLGVEPCFESAKVTSKFSLDDAKKQYAEMMETFKKYTLENFEEGGDNVKNNIEDFAKKRKCSKCEKEIEVTEEFDENEEFVCDECSDEDFAKKKKCEEGCTCEEDIINEDCPVHGDSNDDEDSEEEDFEKKFKEVSAELEKIKADFTDLQSEKALLETELSELREYKATIVKSEKEAEVNSVLEDFSELQSVDGFNEVFEKRYEFTVEELTTKLKVLAFDNGVVIGKKSKKKEQPKGVKFQLDNNNKNLKSSEWDFLDNYTK